jgi:hypothetical protein
LRGLEEGKDRPCVVVLGSIIHAGVTRVYVAPVTHSPPYSSQNAIEIPWQTKRRLGLDDQASWVKVDELNVFIWPGADVRPIRPGGGFAYGMLPRAMTTDILVQVRKLHELKRIEVISRHEG